MVLIVVRLGFQCGKSHGRRLGCKDSLIQRLCETDLKVGPGGDCREDGLRGPIMADPGALNLHQHGGRDAVEITSCPNKMGDCAKHGCHAWIQRHTFQIRSCVHFACRCFKRYAGGCVRDWSVRIHGCRKSATGQRSLVFLCQPQPVFNDRKGIGFRSKPALAKWSRQQSRQSIRRLPFAYYCDVLRSRQFIKKLAAETAGHGARRNRNHSSLAVRPCVGDGDLLRMNTEPNPNLR